ncbi:hypothetical protein QYE76_066037 [Lolium multiflorum]|uniref:Reverse transcriptase Ty1/copia-type domain-containing protein n=1 Tax=Lolium multiflorum TaxID=4521 RepID=A0AAD8S9V4_LOLMU|nr:hypothetical protein QYE76_066037 [Lolium multiflorum]
MLLVRRPPPPSRRCPPRLAPPCATRIGAPPCRRSTMRCSVTGPGSWFPGPLVLTSSPANGSSSSSSALMVLSIERYKARWVVRGFRQRAGVDFTDTFAPVVKPGTIRTVLHLAASRAWPVHQMDVSNAFLHGHLSEQVYYQQPIGFVDAECPDDVCLLSRSLYGLKQAPRAWYQRIAGFLHQLGFRSTCSDASLFVYRTGNDMDYLLLYVDDIILTASTAGLLRQLTDSLRAEFALKDLGPLHYFLGIEVVRRADGFFLHQRKYAHELLERAGMLNCNPAPTPVDTKAKLSASDGSLASDAPFYRSIVGALQYLTLTRPELQYAVQQVCLHMHAPRDAHWAAVKRILRYICGTMGYGMSLHASPSTSTDLGSYSDADWAGCPEMRRSTSGYCVYLGSSLVSWSSKTQPTVSRSSAEAEYRAVANAVAECTWLRQLLSELSCPVDKATVVFCDNVSAVYLSANPVHHRRTKHIELDIHFVRHVGQALLAARARFPRTEEEERADARWVADDEALRVAAEAAAKKEEEAEMVEAAADGWHETANGWYEAAEEGAAAAEEKPVDEEDLALANITAAIEERLADLTRVTKEHEATCRAGRRRLGDLLGQKNELLAMRAARHLIQMPSPERRAREVAAPERGRQERMRWRKENHEAQAVGRVRLEARTDVERAALHELELCGKRMVPLQDAERERARGARTERRRMKASAAPSSS